MQLQVGVLTAVLNSTAYRHGACERGRPAGAATHRHTQHARNHQVEFRERAYAYGRVPMRADRREAATSDRETLAARAVDRALRPLFPPGFLYSVQLTATVLSADGGLDPEVLAINAGSAALLRAGLPWGGPVG